MKGRYFGTAALDYVDGVHWDVRYPMSYVASNGNKYDMCKGTRTDGASSRFLFGHFNFLPADAQNTPTAWLHDKHYRTGHVYDNSVPVRVIRRSEADWLFYDGLKSMNSATGLRAVRWQIVCSMAWLGLRVFGWSVWNRYRRHEVKRTIRRK